MRVLRSLLAASILVGAVATCTATENIVLVLARHHVWMCLSSVWAVDPGDRSQQFAGGEVLYLGDDGKFGIFKAIS
jgi:hypothetical protein